MILISPVVCWYVVSLLSKSISCIISLAALAKRFVSLIFALLCPQFQLLCKCATLHGRPVYFVLIMRSCIWYDILYTKETVMHLRGFPQTSRYFLNRWTNVSFLRRIFLFLVLVLINHECLTRKEEVIIFIFCDIWGLQQPF
jgi:hypothetical protein